MISFMNVSTFQGINAAVALNTPDLSTPSISSDSLRLGSGPGANSGIGICSSLGTVANNSDAGITGGEWWVNRMGMPRPVVCAISVHSGRWWEFGRRFFLQAIIVAGFLFSVTSGSAQSTPPALAVALAGTNLLEITVTNGVGFGNYEVWWTPVLGNLAAYPWMKAAAGTGGQTNFLVNTAGYQNGFFRVLQTPAIGASTPFISYEAESGNLGGGTTVVVLTAPPTTEFSSPQLEASGHAYVNLAGTGQYVLWTNNTGEAISALNVRYSIPDASDGGGIDSTVDLYVNGKFERGDTGQFPSDLEV